MPPRHRFLEPIHNVKDGGEPPCPRPRPRNSGLHLWKHGAPSVALRAMAGSLRRQARGLASRSRAAAKAGGASRDRTDDLKLAKLALSQLSYGPIRMVRMFALVGVPQMVVGRVGVEPTTSRLSGVRSNHLSYRPPLPTLAKRPRAA